MPARYEREIDEILRRIDDWPPRQSRRRTRRIFAWPSWLRPTRIDFSPTQLFLASVGLALVAYLCRAVVPAAAAPIGLLSLVIFVLALVLSVRRRSSRRSPVWRGRPVNLRQRNVFEALWEWWRSWRRRPPR